MKEISILLVDDHVLVRQGIRLLLEEESGLKVVGEADGDEAIPLAQRYRPDVVLMDVHMPKGIDGITATRRKVGSAMQTRLLEALKSPSEHSLPLLSPRETEVLALIAKGHTNKEIADRLHISVKTVEAHRSHIMSRIGAESRADLMEYAVNYDLITHNAP